MAVLLQEQSLEQKANLEKAVSEWLKCKKNFLYFLQNYVWIQDRAKLQTIKWEPWPYLVWVAKCFLKYRLIVIIKARQLGVSWLICTYCLWKAKFYENAKALMLSQGEDEAFDLISKCKFIDNNLPVFLRENRDPDQRGFIGFPSSNSEIKALPSTDKAGRSTDATIVVPDEWEYHPYAEINFAALKPTIDAGGQFIGLTTTDKMKLDTLPKQIYRQAKVGENNFFPIFLPYYLRPGRDTQWLEEIKQDMRSWQVEQEYPSTEEEALETLKTRKLFDINALSQMGMAVREPIKHELSDKYKGLVRIYKLPVVGYRYCQATDPSEGKEDPHAIIVMDVKTGEQVAESHGKTPADLCAQIHDELVRLYYNALNTYESGPGGAGGIMATKLKELGTPNICPSLNVTKRPFTLDIKSGKKGWWSSKALWDVIIWELEEAIRLRQIIPYAKECLDEFSNFIVPEGEEPQKPRGGHDDYIDAWARVWHLRKYAQQGEMRVISMKYRE